METSFLLLIYDIPVSVSGIEEHDGNVPESATKLEKRELHGIECPKAFFKATKVSMHCQDLALKKKLYIWSSGAAIPHPTFSGRVAWLVNNC